MSVVKPKLFMFGGCDLQDIAMSDIISKDFDVVHYATANKREMDNAILDFNKGSFPSMGTSIISMYTKPGPLAQRILEDLYTADKRDILANRHVYYEVTKFPYLEFFKKNAGPSDYLLLGFSPELYTKFYFGNECFSCLPAMRRLRDPNDKLHWLYKEYFTKEEFLLPFDTRESLNWTSDIISDFARDIYEIFQDRVILVKTHLSDLAIASDFSIKKINLTTTDNLLFYRQTKMMSSPTDHTYADRLTLLILEKFRRRYKSDVDVVQLNEPVFIDPNHRWGHSQFHIDQHSRNKLAKIVLELLLKKERKSILYD